MTSHAAQTPSHNIASSAGELSNAHPDRRFDVLRDGPRLAKPPGSEPFAACVAQLRSDPSTERRTGPETHGHAALVLSTTGKRTDFDWCGSLAQAIRTRAARIASGQYDRVCLRRIRRAGSRRNGTRRWLYVSRPVLEWSRTSR
jgi:hypothetical protein